MRQLLVLGFTTLAYTGLAQTKSGVVNGADSKAQIYKVADQPPHADYDANVYIDASIEYPDSAFRKGIEGTVTVQFVVNEDSAISDCKILKGIGGGCDEEAVEEEGSEGRFPLANVEIAGARKKGVEKLGLGD